MKNITDEVRLIEEKARILKALSHPIRLCIVKDLLGRKGCNVSGMQEYLKIPQSTISQHLAKLKDLGIVAGSRSGLEINYYLINDDARRVIESLFND